MDGIQTHPINALQAKNFVAPGSLSFPSAQGELTPPFSNDPVAEKQRNASQAGQVQNGNVVAPATPAATPGAATTQGGVSVSGIVPTLQYVLPLGTFGS